MQTIRLPSSLCIWALRVAFKDLLSDQEKAAHTWSGHWQKQKTHLCLSWVSKWESDSRCRNNSYSPGERVSSQSTVILPSRTDVQPLLQVKFLKHFSLEPSTEWYLRESTFAHPDGQHRQANASLSIGVLKPDSNGVNTWIPIIYEKRLLKIQLLSVSQVSVGTDSTVKTEEVRPPCAIHGEDLKEDS